MSKSHHKPTMQLVPSNSKNPNKPIRYEHLRPGSYFRIFAEPSRGIRTSTDARIYQRAHDHEGFFSFHIASPTPCILMPNDLVVPYRMAPLKHD